jgi:hypothetical protein
MSLLLALTGAAAPPPPPPAVAEASGGWPLWDLVPRRKRRKELDEVLAKPAPAAVVEVLAKPRVEFVKAPKLTATQQAQLDGMFAAIVRAKNEQERARRLAEIARADGEAQQAQMLLARAVEAERVAKQQMMDFDLAFVVAVLIEA